ncbi:AAA family ATPase [Pseudoflavitalea sp. G-6-1-2]|uniref:AAA family ATPase n=1 Tax=Pseudoflavitalea sp. G-6-1-2 TaxID=2728841 RepID=UPI00146E5034|nr:AAA family ATPase [Pseudoflavitalea sp. G-6-1-2]NML22360.1 AAA family ATPase [Pseudoflavitalea sp. G-6-1-2]
MDNINAQKVLTAGDVFSRHFLDPRALYLHYFNAVPSINYIYGIDGEKLFTAMKEKFSTSIRDIHQYRRYTRRKKKYEFSETVLILNNNCILELRETVCGILHNGLQPEFLEEMTVFVNEFKERQRRQPLEINLVVQNSYGMELKAMEINRTKLDIDLYYEDDFKETDEIIRTRLNRKKDKGLVLLHGLPGTGKTTYLRYLVGKIKKRVLFLSPAIAGNLMNPEFIELLVDNPNSVLVIEDAENIIMDRRYNSGSAVSNLLNISDGLMADFLNVQIICTFNSSVTLIDNALMRKGRLIARYEFGKLSKEKAQRLSNHLGFKTEIQEPMTIAEIANPNEKAQPVVRTEVIGFRRNLTS